MIIVIGGGPAGLAAAAAAADAGAHVRLIDSGSALGGQYWRGTKTPLMKKVSAHPRIEVSTQTSVWNITREENVTILRLLRDGSEEEVRAERVIIATGAHDRSLPFPGWTLPGVMTAGGAQALIKGQKLAFAQRVVVAGSGPFLLPVAAGLVEFGVDVVEVCEWRSPLRWLRQPWALIGNPGRILEAGRYLRVLRRHGTRLSFGARVVAAHGAQALDQVEIEQRGLRRVVDVDGLAIGWGFTPDLSVALGCGLTPVVGSDGQLVVEVDRHQRTSVPGVFAAGEVTGIGGARLAQIEGAIAGRAAAARRIPFRWRERRAHHRLFARALSWIYAVPRDWQDQLTDETVICRCEEVTLGTIRSTITELGASDTRSLKLLARTGMGMCQGRICAQSVSEIVAQECGRAVEVRDLLAHRPVITPIPLGTLASRERNADEH